MIMTVRISYTTTLGRQPKRVYDLIPRVRETAKLRTFLVVQFLRSVEWQLDHYVFCELDNLN